MSDLDLCNACGKSFSAGEVSIPSSMLRRGYAATRGPHLEITQYCCESCTEDLMPPAPMDACEQSELNLDELNLATEGLA